MKQGYIIKCTIRKYEPKYDVRTVIIDDMIYLNLDEAKQRLKQITDTKCRKHMYTRDTRVNMEAFLYSTNKGPTVFRHYMIKTIKLKETRN